MDAAALFWLTRKRLDFQQNVESDERIRIIHNDQAWNSPRNIAEALSDFVGIALPARSMTPECVHSPKASGRPICTRADVEKLCQKTLDSFVGRPEL
jgi:hypothetical protein